MNVWTRLFPLAGAALPEVGLAAADLAVRWVPREVRLHYRRKAARAEDGVMKLVPTKASSPHDH